MDILYIIIVGAIAGYIADVLMRDNGFGLIVNIILGIVGGFVGTWAFNKLGITIGSGWISDIIRSAAGAILILFVVGLFRRGR